MTATYPTSKNITHCTGFFNKRGDELVVVAYQDSYFIAYWDGEDASALRQVAVANSPEFAVRRAQGIAKLYKLERSLDWYPGSARPYSVKFSGWVAPRC